MKKYIINILIIFCLVVSFSIDSTSQNTRYWVNGSGEWGQISHWSATSGGAGGASVPTMEDDVIFDDNSLTNGSDVTILMDAECSSFNWNLRRVNAILRGNENSNLRIHGSIYISENIQNEFYGNILLRSESGAYNIEIKTSLNSKIDIDYSSASWNLKNDLTTTKDINLIQGTLYTNGYTVDCYNFIFSGFKNRELYLGNSDVLVTSVEAYDITNLTTDFGTSSIYFRDKPDFRNLNYWNLDYNNIKSIYYYSAIPLPEIGAGPGAGMYDYTINEGCFGLDNGTATITNVTSLGPDWNIDLIPNTDPVINHVAVTLPDVFNNIPDDGANEYLLFVDDNDGNPGNFDLYTFSINPDDFNIDTEDFTDPTTVGGSDGTITITGTDDGGGNVFFSIDGGGTYPNPANDGAFAGLVADDYQVVIKNANDCEVNGSLLTLSEPNFVIDSVKFTDITCFDEGDGEIIVYQSNGVGTVEYSNDGGGSWQAGSTFSNLTGGTYNIQVKDDNETLIYAGNPITMTNPDELVIDSTKIVQMLCTGDDDAEITVYASGGTNPLEYRRTGMPIDTYQGSNVFDNLSSGSYYVTVNDANDCKAYSIKQVITPANPIVISDVDVSTYYVFCYGDTIVDITITASGGVGDLEYTFNGGVDWTPNNDTTNLPAGDYTIQVRDENGCVEIWGTETISQGAEIVLTSVVYSDPLDCFGDSDGTITINASGGTGTLRYSIDDTTSFQNNKNFLGLTAGTYYTGIKDGVGCFKLTDTVTITEPSLLEVVASDFVLDCNGDTDGTSTAVASGGNGGYSYKWYNDRDLTPPEFNTGATANALDDGIYYVEVTDSKLCTAWDSTIISENPPVTYLESHTDALCKDACDGTITINPSGGTGTYQYYLQGPGWTGSETDPYTFNGICDGIYQINARDDNGCTATAQPVAIAEPNAVTFSVVISDETPCNSSNNGSISISALGGDSDYLYSKDGGSNYFDNGGTFNGLQAGDYDIRVKDGNDCESAISTETVDEPGPVTFGVAITDATCFGDNDGEIEVTAAGGSGTYAFSKDDGDNWTSAANPYTFTTLLAGDYDIKVRDDLLCESTRATETVDEPTEVTHSVVITDASCNGVADGTIEVTAGGGDGTYEFYREGPGWTGVEVSPYTFTAVGAGDYDIQVRDATGCLSTLTEETVGEPAPVTHSVVITDATCNAGSDGTIEVTAGGGDGTYEFYIEGTGWTGVEVSPYTFTGLTAADYDIQVRDGNGCTSILTAETVGEPLVVSHSVVITDATCNLGSDGEIEVTAGGGNGTYQFYIEGTGWTGNETSPYTFTGLSAADYDIQVRDGNGCTSILTAETVGEPTAVTHGVVITDATCFGDNDGAIQVTAAGGDDGTYEFYIEGTGWTGITANPHTFTTLLADDYDIQVRDGKGCVSVLTVETVDEPTEVTHSVVITDASCNGVADGTIEVTAGGGDGTYEFYREGPGWTGVEVSPYTFTAVGAGDYDIQVRDATGCLSTLTEETVGEPAPVTHSVVITDATCNAGSDGTIEVTAGGGDGTYEFYIEGTGWTGVEVSPYTFTGLTAADYDIQVRDGNGCTSILTAETVGEPLVVSHSVVITDATCNLGSDGEIEVTAGGGNGTYQFYIEGTGWTGNETSPYTFTGLSAADYDIQVRDGNGCTSILTAETVGEPTAVTHGVVITDATCFGDNDGAIQVTAAGGDDGTYEFYIEGTGWTGITANPHTFTTLLADDYDIQVRDGKGCVSVLTVETVDEPTEVTHSVVITDASCNGVADGTIEVTAGGGDGTYEFYREGPGWTGVEVSPYTFTAVGAGDYDIQVRDATGCLSTLSVETVNEPAELTAAIIDSLLSCGSVAVVNAGQTFLPDGTGSTYTSTVTQTDFLPASMITTADDIQNLCLDLEHSALGDLTIELECPNGQTMTIYDEPAVGETWLGEPVKGIPDLNPGTGYLYCFNNSNITTFEDAVDWDSLYTYTDLDGNDHVDKKYIPEGGYATEEAFTSLIGCPLNGDWSLKITDNFPGDNGYIFTWNLTFDESTYPANYCNGMAVVEATGGNGGFNYLWSNGETNDTINNLCADNYNVTITDTKGCSVQTTAFIEDVDIQIDSVVTDVLCSGDNSGDATVNVTGGNEPYDFLWETGHTSSTYTGLSAGTYRFTITDFNSCEYYDSVIVGYTNLFDYDFINVTTLACNSSVTGSHYGSAEVDVTSGTGPYQYAWSNGETTVVADSLLLGWNYVTVTDDGTTCSFMDSVEILDGPIYSASILGTDTTHVLCNGDATGGAIVTAVGGTPAAGSSPFTYTWSDGQTDSTAINLAAGSYFVTVYDDNLCEVTVPVTITQPTRLAVVIDTTPTTGCNGIDGEIILNASGGSGSYEFSKDGGLNWTGITANPHTFTGLSQGIYNVQIRDGNFCILDTTAEVLSDTDLKITGFDTTSVTCNGLNDGTATVLFSGGTGPYDIQWFKDDLYTDPFTDSTDALFTNMHPDSMYYVTITDFLTCIARQGISISEPDVLVANIADSTMVGCFGESTGDATATPSGGTGDYTYNWEDALSTTVGTDSIATGLSIGKYYVTVSDENLCEAYDSVTITQPAAALSATFTDTTLSNCGASDGEVIITPSGGTPIYTYVWQDETDATIDTDSTLNGVPSGWYYITVTDNNLCTYNDSIQLRDTTDLLVTVLVDNDVLCNSDSTGQATASPVNGSGSYTYEWSNGEVGMTADSLWAGSFTVTLTDLTSTCKAFETFMITEPDSLKATPTIVDVACNGGSDGSITVTPFGGTPSTGNKPYAYDWSMGTTDSIASDLIAGNYSVTVSDANLCTFIYNGTVNENSIITADYATTLTQCADSTGTATVSNIAGGTPFTVGDPYKVSWSHPDWATDSIGLAISNLWVDFYNVSIEDSLGCTKDTTIQVDANSDLDITMTDSVNVSCYGFNDGIAVATPSGGTSPYSYEWSDIVGTTDSVAINLFGGIVYTVTVTDDDGCIAVNSITLSQPSQILPNFMFIDPIVCSADTLFTLYVQPTGGTPYQIGDEYDVIWRDTSGEAISTDTILEDLKAGKYYVYLTDSIGCVGEDSITIIQPTNILVDYTMSETECADSTGSITINTITGGIPFTVGNPYLVRWSHPNWTIDSTDMILSGLWVDAFYLEIEDSLGCIYYDTVLVEDNSNLNFEVQINNHITCLDRCDANAEITTIINITGTPQFEWYLGDDVKTTQVVDSLCVGDHRVRVIDDADGCSHVKTFTITDEDALRSIINFTDDISCPGESGSGEATAIGIGGHSPYSYEWDYESSLNQTITGLSPGIYRVTVSDDNDNVCSVVDSVTIVEDPIRIADIYIQHVLCFGDTTGSIKVFADGGHGSYTYEWFDGETLLDSDTLVENLPAGTYTIVAKDAGSCEATQDITIEQPLILASIIDITETNCSDSSGIAVVTVGGGVLPYSFAWSDDLPANDTVENLWISQFYVTITDSNNCVIVDSVYMIDNSPFNIQPGNIGGITCYGYSNGSANVIALDGIEPYTYSWSHDNGLNNSEADDLGPGIYIVTVTDAETCVRTDTIAKLEYPEDIIVTFRDTVSIDCFGECGGEIAVDVSGGTVSDPSEYSFQWKQEGTDILDEITNSIDSLCAGTYSVLVKDARSCPKEREYESLSPTKIQIIDTVITDANCNAFDESGKIEITLNGGTPFMMASPTLTYLIEWSTGEDTEVIEDLNSGRYYLTVTDSLNCQIIDSLNVGAGTVVMAEASIHPSLQDTDTTICWGDRISLYGFYEPVGATLLWTPDGSVSNSAIYNPEVFPTTETEYIFTVSSGDCYNYDTVTVDVFERVVIDIGPNDSLFIGDIKQIIPVGGADNTTYLWYPNYNISSIDTVAPVVYPEDDTTYYVIATTGLCSTTDSISYHVVKDLDPPTGITPNGDGRNDTWILDGISEFPNVQVKIFNRWGKIVFESSGYYTPWDGKNKKGKDLPIGTYYFIIDLNDDRGTAPISGPLTIMR